MLNRPAQKVFLDANVLIKMGSPPGGPLGDRLHDLVKAGIIEIVTTDLTIQEVSKKHTQNDYDVIKEISRHHFRKLVTTYTGIELRTLSKTELKAAIRQKFDTAVLSMMTRLKSRILSLDQIKPSVVFNAYSNESGFFSGEIKRSQFADAFIFETLKHEASATSPLIIVSEDNDFRSPVESEPHITLLKSVPALFEHLGFNPINVPQLSSYFDAHYDQLISLADAQMRNRELRAGNIPNAEIDFNFVDDVQFLDYVAFQPLNKEGSILVVGKARISCVIHYWYPNWSSVPSHDDMGEPLEFEELEENAELEIFSPFSMSIKMGSDGTLFAVEQLSFPDFTGINLPHSRER